MTSTIHTSGREIAAIALSEHHFLRVALSSFAAYVEGLWLFDNDRFNAEFSRIMAARRLSGEGGYSVGRRVAERRVSRENMRLASDPVGM